jgi:phage-related protein
MLKKPVIWVGSSKKDLEDLGEVVKDAIGYALFQAQVGHKSAKAKPLQGFGGAGVLEIVEIDSAGTYRAVYTVKFQEAIAVLHVFQKKSTQGIKTPKQDVELIKHRLKLAEDTYQSWLKTRRSHGK